MDEDDELTAQALRTPSDDSTEQGDDAGTVVEAMDPDHTEILAGFSAGSLVAGRYRIRRRIGQGGLGEVFEAENLELGEIVALKMLKPEKARDQSSIERFKREIQLARRITHPNVCRIFDAGTHRVEHGPALSYLTMELLGGETMSSRLRRVGRMTPEEVLPLLRQLIAAIAAIHATGIIHRDLKTSNMMVEPDPLIPGAERLVVTDLGLSRDLNRDDEVFRTRSGLIVGTLEYIAPEQLAGEPLGPHTDVYALGVVLYRMLTGVMPFEGQRRLDAALLRLDHDPRPIKELLPDLDSTWVRVVHRCLKRHAEDRFESVEEILEELEPKPEPAKASRLPWLLSAAAIAIAVVFGLKDLDQRQSNDERPSRLVQLTTEPGLELDPSFSPDGQTLVFATNSGESLELFTLQLTAGGARRQITSDGADNVQPDWSGDGRLIAYASLRDGGIRVIPALGGAQRVISSFGSRPRFSPDGRRIVFQEDGRYDIAARASAAQASSTLWVAELDGSSALRLTEVGSPVGGHGEPRFSSDGSRIAFSANSRRGSEVWSLRLEDFRLEALIVGWRLAGHPVYSPDGKWLYFTGIPRVGREADSHSLWRLELDRSGRPRGRAERLAALGSSTIRHIGMSTDGSHLALGVLSTTSELRSMGIDGSDPKTLVSASGRATRPAFSADGRWLAYDGWTIGRELDVWALDLSNPGSEPHPLTQDSARDSQASWDLSGRVVYVSERSGNPEVWASDPEDGFSERIADLGDDADWVRISPDGQRLVFNAQRDHGGLNLWLHDLSKAKSERLTDHPEMVGFAVWAPDGTWLAAEARDGSDSQIVKVDTATGAITQLSSGPGRRWPYGISPDATSVSFAGLRDGTWGIYVLDIATGTEELLVSKRGRGHYLRYPTFAPTGDRLVYESASTEADLWLLE